MTGYGGLVIRFLVCKMGFWGCHSLRQAIQTHAVIVASDGYMVLGLGRAIRVEMELLKSSAHSWCLEARK